MNAADVVAAEVVAVSPAVAAEGVVANSVAVVAAAVKPCIELRHLAVAAEPRLSAQQTAAVAAAWSRAAARGVELAEDSPAADRKVARAALTSRADQTSAVRIDRVPADGPVVVNARETISVPVVAINLVSVPAWEIVQVPSGAGNQEPSRQGIGRPALRRTGMHVSHLIRAVGVRLQLEDAT